MITIEQKDIMEHINQMAAMYGMPSVQLFEELRKELVTPLGQRLESAVFHFLLPSPKCVKI